MVQSYDIAAYIWPAYHDEPRWRHFMPMGEGEWEIMRKSKPKFEGHYQPRIPLWGYTNESDPNEMERKIDVAVNHGVNVFIFDWYWYENQPFLEDALNEGFLAAKNVKNVKNAKNNKEMRFYLMWANHDATTLWEYENSHEPKVIWPGSVTISEFETIMDRVIEKYFSLPSYYKIDGSPVFSIYEVKNLIEGLGGIKQTQKTLKIFRKKVKGAGFPDLHLQAIPWNINHRKLKRLKFDSITSYQWAHHFSPQGLYKNWAEKAIKQWKVWNKKFSIPYFPHVSIGWDTNPRFKEYKATTIIDSTPELFGNCIGQAMDYIDANKIVPPLLTVNSWNEWCEGSYLEPDMKYKMGYLEAVKAAIEKRP
jgi:Glycosyltransferase WbsX